MSEQDLKSNRNESVNGNTQSTAVYEILQNIFKLALVLRKDFKRIVSITLIFAFISVIYALNIPNTYRSEALLISNSTEPLQASQVSALASFAGLQSGNVNVDDATLAMSIFYSRDFVKSLLQKHDLVIPVMTLNGWNSKSKTNIYSDAYDFKKGLWNDQPPTDGEIYKKFISMVNISQSLEQPVYTVSAETLSPEFSQLLAIRLVEEINESVRVIRANEATVNIKYLEGQLNQNSTKDMKKTLYDLIFEQTKDLMMAEVRDEFVFKIIDSPIVPEQKVYPVRSLICAIITLLGFFFAMSISLVKNSYKQTLEHLEKN